MKEKWVLRFVIVTTSLSTATLLTAPNAHSRLSEGGTAASAEAANVALCAHAQPRGRETRVTAIANLESKIGRRFAAHKDFFKWNDAFPTAQQIDDARKGRAPAINWVARRRGGGLVLWRDIAAGRQDAVIRRWARDLKAYGRRVYVTFHHEPENDPGNGGPAEFIAAFRHTRAVFQQQRVSNVIWVLALMAHTFNQGDPNRWYPGDRYVDMLGLNGYNWYPGQRDATWRTFSDIFAKAYRWAANRGKAVMISETGVQEDPRWTSGNRKAQWFLSSLSTLKSWPLVRVFCYWHSRGVHCDTCYWWIDSSKAATNAFREIANDPYMGRFPRASSLP